MKSGMSHAPGSVLSAVPVNKSGIMRSPPPRIACLRPLGMLMPANAFVLS